MIAPFAGEHIAGAARLLAERHARHRAAEPLLADGDAHAWVEQAWTRDGVSGVVALKGDEMEGYLLGRVAESRFWQTHAVVDRAGAVARDPETMRDLYAAAAPHWLDAGARLQVANVPALADQLDPWYRLGFGQMQLHGVRETGGGEPGAMAIRTAVRDDLDAAIMPLASVIWEHQAGAAAFTGLHAPSADEIRSSWAESFDVPDDALFLAELNDGVAGMLLLEATQPDVGVGERTVGLAVCAVAPEARGHGVGTALVEHALGWAEGEGYETVITDWRVPNLLSSRFWPARGFRPTFHRLHRMLRSG